MFNNKFKKAFSLAEILLTMSILGTIAVITYPSLQNHSRQKVLHSQLSKAYSNIVEATSALETKYGDVQYWKWDDSSEIMRMYSEYMNFVSSEDGYQITQDGFAWKIEDGQSFSVDTQGDGGVAVVDLNSLSKAPNKFGDDRFAFRIRNTGVYPFGAQQAETDDEDMNKTYTIYSNSK